MFARQNLDASRKDSLVKELSLLPPCFILTPLNGDKSPYRDQWQEELPISRNLIAKDIRTGRAKGYGLRTGEISNGLLAVDVDGNLANALLQELSNGQQIPETVAFTSGLPGKCQYLLQVPPEYWNAIATKKFKTEPDENGKSQLVELRWRVCQSVLPPSVHPITGSYKWVEGCSPTEREIATAPNWLIELMLVEPVTGAEAQAQPNTIATEISRARSYLAALSTERADDYDTWLKIGMALKSVDDCLLTDWDIWSQQSDKYKPGDCESKWRSFKRDETNKRVTIASLGEMAITDGWKSSAESNRFDNRRSGGDGNPPVSKITLEDRVKEILERSQSQSERKSAFISLAESTKVQLRELEALAEAIESDAETSIDLADAKVALPKLLETQNRTIDPSDYLWGDGGRLAQAMKTVAFAMPTSPAMIFTTFIPASASRIGTSSRIVIKPSARYKQPCVFWAGIVARSGQLKSPAQSVTIDPLVKLEIDSKKAYDKALQEYEEAKENWQEGDSKPKKPEPRKRFVTKDSTLETLESIHSSNPRGLLYYRDELAAMHKSRNAFKANGTGADTEAELDQWNGAPLIVDRKQREIAIDRTAISRTGSIQYEILQSLAGDHLDSNGNMARWIFCAVKSPPRYISFDDLRDTGISELLETLYRNLEKLPTHDYLIDKDAQDVFKTWQHSLVDAERQENHPGLKLIFPKIEAYGARFALWLHCVNAILAGETPQASINGKTMRKAVQLASFYLEQAKLLYATNSPQYGLTGRLLKIHQFAEGKPQGITARDVKRNLNEFRKIPTSEIKRDFSTLVETGNFQVKDDRFIAVGDFVGDVGDLSVAPPTAKTFVQKESQPFVGDVGDVNIQSKGLNIGFKENLSNPLTSPKPNNSPISTDITDITDKIYETFIDSSVDSVGACHRQPTNNPPTAPTGDDKSEFEDFWNDESDGTGGSTVINRKPLPTSGGGATAHRQAPTSTDSPPTSNNISGESENQNPSTSVKDNTQELKAEYILVQDGQSLAKALEPLQKAEVLAVDVETSGGLNPLEGKIRLIQIAATNQPVVIADMEALTPSDLAPLHQLMAGPAIKIGHNFKFDWKFLTKAGLQPQAPYFDTMLASKLLTAGIPGKHSLKDIVLKYLDIELNKESQKSDWSGELSPAQLEYAALDAAVLLRLQQLLKLNLIEEELLEAAEIEFSAIAATAEMEISGILLDKPKWKHWGLDLQESLDGEAAELEKLLLSRNCQMDIFQEIKKINLNSPKQVLKALQEMGIPVESTGKQTLVTLADEYPIIKTLLKYRQHSKAVSSFCLRWPTHINQSTGRIHSDYVQLGTDNGRFSCKNPNLQQVPRDRQVRSCFIPAPGHQFVIADYSQIELRVAAEISGDRTMIEAYRNGDDLHKLTASLVTGKPIDQVSKSERQAAKAVNFGLIYGCGAKRLKQQAKQDYGVELSLEECETFRKRFFKAYIGVARWHKKLIKSNLWETRTLSGRRRTWTDKQPWITGLAPAIVSGSASDIAKRALAMLPTALDGTGAKLVAFIHDEFILECPESTAIKAAEILQATMIKAGETYLKIVPVEAEVKIAESWADK